jgi:hypothetical protein
MPKASLLDEFLEAWRYTRQGVIAEVGNLPEKAFGFRPSDASRTVLELVQHVIESGQMMAGELSRPDGDFLRQGYPEFLAEYGRGVSRFRTKKALLDALRRTHRADDRPRLVDSRRSASRD